MKLVLFTLFLFALQQQTTFLGNTIKVYQVDQKFLSFQFKVEKRTLGGQLNAYLLDYFNCLQYNNTGNFTRSIYGAKNMGFGQALEGFYDKVEEIVRGIFIVVENKSVGSLVVSVETIGVLPFVPKPPVQQPFNVNYLFALFGLLLLIIPIFCIIVGLMIYCYCKRKRDDVKEDRVIIEQHVPMIKPTYVQQPLIVQQGSVLVPNYVQNPIIGQGPVVIQQPIVQNPLIQQGPVVIQQPIIQQSIVQQPVIQHQGLINVQQPVVYENQQSFVKEPVVENQLDPLYKVYKF